MTPKHRAERLLAVWGQYQRHPWQVGGYPSQTAEARAGEGSGGGAWDGRLRVQYGRPPAEVDLVDGIVKADLERTAIYLRYRTRKGEDYFAGRLKKALTDAENRVEGWIVEHWPK